MKIIKQLIRKWNSWKDEQKVQRRIKNKITKFNLYQYDLIEKIKQLESKFQDEIFIIKSHLHLDEIDLVFEKSDYTFEFLTLSMFRFSCEENLKKRKCKVGYKNFDKKLQIMGYNGTEVIAELHFSDSSCFNAANVVPHYSNDAHKKLIEGIENPNLNSNLLSTLNQIKDLESNHDCALLLLKEGAFNYYLKPIFNFLLNESMIFIDDIDAFQFEIIKIVDEIITIEVEDAKGKKIETLNLSYYDFLMYYFYATESESSITRRKRRGVINKLLS